MMQKVRRIYVEKRKDYAVAGQALLHDLKTYLGLDNLEDVRVLCRYDIENISDDIYEIAKNTIFSEPPVDVIVEEQLELDENETVFSVEALPGQFDQRADSALQCVQLLGGSEDLVVQSAMTYIIKGQCSKDELDQIKNYCINPVDSRECDETKPETLMSVFDEPADIEVIADFTSLEEAPLKELYDSLNLAMTFKDFLHIQNYFVAEEDRNPTMTEIRVLDTYWSDHCRHTTFLTELKNISFEEGYYQKPIMEAYNLYQNDRKDVFGDRKDKYVSLMDIALMAMRKLKKDGKLDDMEVSDEINACSLIVPVEIDGQTEEWLISFKNETHNHPTEIEPFGGAATCLGGAIRDPLSGRSYVYQAMRVTGAADPTVPLSETLKGKLPQRKIVTGAADGYSSYGNQIGLATGYVNEIYHPNYAAKRMEIGAVMGAAPRKNVMRETCEKDDIIILLGGRTGRDGCGGATGSSKAHTVESIDTCGAEVQKGNPPTERKIQRLFRKEEVSRMIKKCNDFGAGGVSVAIGELAEGLQIDLDSVPKKYAGLDGTELAISESQERMAVVVDPADVNAFLAEAHKENLEAVVAAVVTDTKRLVMVWRGKEIVNVSRAFLDTNGAHQETDVTVTMPDESSNYWKQFEIKEDTKTAWLNNLSDLNNCSQKGLVEMFDGSIGASSVFMPFGGKYQLTPVQTMAAKLPVLSGKCDTVTLMSYGYDPYLSSWSPYHGAVYAVVDSLAKIVAVGGDYSKVRFTFQEYFKRLGNDSKRWGEPMAALLGAYHAQMGFGLASIGGKDSMSGTFNEIDVPPTLVSFAVDTADYNHIISPELKTAGSQLVMFSIDKDEYDMPDYTQIMNLYGRLHGYIRQNLVSSAYALGYGGVAAAVSKMAFGNKLGVTFNNSLTKDQLFAPLYGNIIAEVPADQLEAIDYPYTVIGQVTDQAVIIYDDMKLPLEEALSAWTTPLESVFPTKSHEDVSSAEQPLYDTKDIYICNHKIARPKVFIPVFPGTNCEYDTLKAFEKAGAQAETIVFKNLSANDIEESITAFKKAVDDAQILMFPGGFSAGDEPDGSGKFIATAFRNARLKEAVMKLLNERDGLALGICNGFQALIKLGLLPYGEITDQKTDSPTLTINSIGRHVSKIAYTKVVSNKSPWLAGAQLGGVYSVPVSHGEGRFVASEEWLKKLFKAGCVATQYVDLDGKAVMNEAFNPNGSYMAIEGITSPDGRILGKMAHSERIGDGVAKNIFGEQDQKIFESGVQYFK